MARYGSRTIHREQLSWEEFVSRATEYGNSDVHMTDESRGGTFEQAISMATDTGFMPTSPNIDDLLSHIETDLADRTMMTFDTEFNVSGGAVDVGRYLSGEPECMIDLKPIKVMRTGRVIRLAVVVNVAGNVEPNQIINRGAAIMALLDVFNKMQHPVEINVVLSWEGQGSVRTVLVVKVQDANQPLDMGRVMYALAHPSCPRHLGFSNQNWLLERKVVNPSQLGPKVSYGLGSRFVTVVDMEDETVENMIILPELLDSHRWDERYSVNWIKTQLEKIENGSV